MTEITGYTPLSEAEMLAMNENKFMEERILRGIEQAYDNGMSTKSDCNTAIEHVKTAFMWVNRAIAQPDRVELPED